MMGDTDHGPGWVTTQRILHWGLEQTIIRLREVAERSYRESRVIRKRQDVDEQTGEMINTDPDDMYELGHAEGVHVAYMACAEQIEKAAKALKVDA
jgi:hypothetical protein